MSWAIDSLLVTEMPGEGLRIDVAYKFDGEPVFHGNPVQMNIGGSNTLTLDTLVQTIWDAGPPLGSWERASLLRDFDGTLTVVVLAEEYEPYTGPRYAGIGGKVGHEFG